MAVKKSKGKGTPKNGNAPGKQNPGFSGQVPKGAAELLDLQPGSSVTLDFTAGPRQLPCTLMGFLQDNSLIVRLPLVAGIDPATEDGSQVTVRFVHQGTVHGFETRVVGRYIKGPLRFLFLACPNEIEQLNLRRHVRINCYIPAVAQVNGQDLQGVIVDLSPGGARYAGFAEKGKPLPMVDVDNSLTLSGNVEGREVFNKLPCLVRSVSKDNRRLLLGLAFAEPDSEAVEMIGDYVLKMAQLIEETEL